MAQALPARSEAVRTLAGPLHSPQQDAVTRRWLNGNKIPSGMKRDADAAVHVHLHSASGAE